MEGPWWVGVYAATGACQPLIVERLARAKLAPQIALWPMLANCVGMSLVLPLSCLLGMRPSRRPVRLGVAWKASVVDFGSAVLLNTALVRSGATAFTLAYSSCALFVALIGTRSLRVEQWSGVILVTLGLALYSRGGGGSDDAFSLALALLGSVGHSTMYVCAERALATGALTPFELSTAMGTSQSLVLIAWSSLCVAFFDLGVARPLYALKGYAALAVVDAAHALSFFATLGDRGALSASLLKGVQIVLVYVASQLLFQCYSDGRPLECLAQRAATAKSAAVALVVLALVVFYGKPTSWSARGSPLATRPTIVPSSSSDKV